MTTEEWLVGEDKPVWDIFSLWFAKVQALAMTTQVAVGRSLRERQALAERKAKHIAYAKKQWPKEYRRSQKRELTEAEKRFIKEA